MEAMKRARVDDSIDYNSTTTRFKGMAIDVPGDIPIDVDTDVIPDTPEEPSKPLPVRKTRQQKLKAARVRAEVRFLSLSSSFIKQNQR